MNSHTKDVDAIIDILLETKYVFGKKNNKKNHLLTKCQRSDMTQYPYTLKTACDTSLSINFKNRNDIQWNFISDLYGVIMINTITFCPTCLKLLLDNPERFGMSVREYMINGNRIVYIVNYINDPANK